MSFEFGKIDNCELMLVQTATLRNQDAQQTVTFEDVPDAGTFTLTYSGQTTANIAYNAAASAIESALEALSNITSVTVAGNFTTGFTVTFDGTDGNQDHAKMTASSSLTKTGQSVDIYIEHTGRGYDNLGNYKKGVDSDTTINCNVQPLTGKEIEQLPEYDKSRRHMNLWTKTGITTRDYVVYESSEFEVNKVELWRGYYKALLIERQNQT